MRNHFFKYVQTAFFLLFLTVSAFAQKKDSTQYQFSPDTVAPQNYLLEFPMSELMNMKVTAASKKEEKISDAPSSITAYTSSDLEKMGYYSLVDLASITSGYSVNYQYGEQGFETRGQTAGGFNNNKHLLIIDGIPVNFARSYKAQAQEELPLFFTQQVEFLKGPASALYGVSAFYGVINLISKEPVSNGTIAESKFSGGNWNNNYRWMGNIYHRNNVGATSLNVGLFHKDPSGDYVGTTQNPNYRYWDKNNSLFLKVSHRFTQGFFYGLSIGVIYMQRTGGLGESWSTINQSTEVNSITWRTMVPYVKYQRALSKKWTLNAYLKGNNSVEEGQFQLFDKATQGDTLQALRALSIYRSNVRNVELLTEFRYELNTRNSFIVGINYDRRMETGNPSSYAYNVVSPDSVNAGFAYPIIWDFRDRSFYFNTISGYGQYQKSIPLLAGLTITGGLRFDMGIIDTFKYHQLSPRVAVVQRITPELTLKLMTGRALRAPGIKELGLTSQYLEERRRNNLNGPDLPSIRPEIIQTFEAGLSYGTKRWRLSGSVFYNETLNEMRLTTLKDPIGNDDTLRGNWIENLTGTTTSKGFELDLMIALNNQWKIFSNYTYALSHDQNHQYFAGVPVSRVNGGIMYSFNGRYKARTSVVAKYIDGYLIGGPTKERTAGFTFLDANCIFPFTENLSAEFQVRNILNQKVLFPTAGVPLPGRTWQASLNVMFR